MFTDNIKVLTETLHGKNNNRNILNMSQAKQVPYHHGKILTDEDVDGKKKYPDYCRTMTIKDANGVIRELVFPRALDLDRPKRSRTTFSREQLYYLEGEFQKKQYLVGKERSELANQLRLTETQVKVWFQNRRTKYKRDRERKTELKDMKESFGNGEFLKYLQPPSQPCACFPYLSCQQYPYTSFSPM